MTLLVLSVLNWLQMFALKTTFDKAVSPFGWKVLRSYLLFIWGFDIDVSIMKFCVLLLFYKGKTIELNDPKYIIRNAIIRKSIQKFSDTNITRLKYKITKVEISQIFYFQISLTQLICSPLQSLHHISLKSDSILNMIYVGALKKYRKWSD